jgi:hypothetical protein
VLLGTPLGNLLGTYWELEWNKGKMKKKTYLSACWGALLRVLAAWNFYFQNCLSSFLAWANIPPL